MYWPKKSSHGYQDKMLKQYFNTKKEKKEYLKKNNLCEDGSMETEKHRVRTAIKEVNEDRAKRGQKELSSKRIVGDSPASKYLKIMTTVNYTDGQYEQIFKKGGTNGNRR